MSNIHLIPTDKPSRLYQLKNDILRLDYKIDKGEANKHIYITSDEEIKEGAWLIVNDEDVMQMKSSYDNDMSGEDIWVGDSLNGYATYKDNCKKITLTTDQDLIKDGVQAIEDEFLEWFVKNPTCESIEVVKEGYKNNGMIDESTSYRYKIIIPKEERTMITDWLAEHGDPEIYKKVEKQLELEEAAERLHPEEWDWREREIFIAGAKWQAERMYSEEDLRTAYNISKNANNFDEWFEQFKKS